MLLKCINNIEVLINNTINIKHNVNLYIKPELSSIIKDSFNPIKIENIQTLFDLDNEFYYNKIKSIKEYSKSIKSTKKKLIDEQLKIFFEIYKDKSIIFGEEGLPKQYYLERDEINFSNYILSPIGLIKNDESQDTLLNKKILYNYTLIQNRDVIFDSLTENNIVDLSFLEGENIMNNVIILNDIVYRTIIRYV